jgi:hypothetical protein
MTICGKPSVTVSCKCDKMCTGQDDDDSSNMSADSNEDNCYSDNDSDIVDEPSTKCDLNHPHIGDWVAVGLSSAPKKTKRLFIGQVSTGYSIKHAVM